MGAQSTESLRTAEKSEVNGEVQEAFWPQKTKLLVFSIRSDGEGVSNWKGVDPIYSDLHSPSTQEYSARDFSSLLNNFPGDAVDAIQKALRNINLEQRTIQPRGAWHIHHVNILNNEEPDCYNTVQGFSIVVTFTPRGARRIFCSSG